MTPIVFLDCETTGLALDDDIWEFAAIRREPDGTEATHHFFINHDPAKAALMPARFAADREARYDPNTALSRATAAQRIHEITRGRAHIVGAVPSFDTERIARMIRQLGCEPDWHYHLIDVETLAAGWLIARERFFALIRPFDIEGHRAIKTGARLARDLPYRSDDLSRACGVEPPSEADRHTALGDADWCMRWWDAITGGAA